MAEHRLPYFIIGGAARSGTTWVYCLLDRHPEIYMAKPIVPEPKFFLVDELYNRGLNYYSQTWFPPISTTVIYGEKSTNYLESAVAAGRIYKDIPDIKLIFILRNPIFRAFSNYCWSRMNGLEHKDFITALALEGQRERELPEKFKYSRPHAYFSRGLYADLLGSYFALFKREQILCLRYEDILEEPDILAQKIQGFLGIANRLQDAKTIGVINPSEKKESTIPEEAYNILRSRYLEPTGRLYKLLGSDFKEWENF